jgi:FtsP/CotA-like multicopper oxidase with cupredoxin domain
LTLNNIPIAYPDEIPAVIRMRPGERQFWRVSNSSADTVLHLEVLYDGVPQTVQIADFDGVPAGSQDGHRRARLVAASDVFLPTAGRAEFIVKAPSPHVKNASLVTLAIDTGPDGDNDTQRTLATLQTSSKPLWTAAVTDGTIAAPIGPAWKQRFENLATAKVTAERTLYFSENNPLSQFFITVQGATPTLFDPNNPPAIVTTQGSVEDWTIQNRTLEVHEFHIHQTHFLVLAQNNFAENGSAPDPGIQRQFLDTIQVPYWDGNPKDPYPSVKLRIDFRGHDIGDFVYHCHIAEHEDGGMMAIIRVTPALRP